MGTITVFGATGFTGQRVVEELLQKAPHGTTINVAGRSALKLEALKAKLQGGERLTVTASVDVSDPVSLQRMAEATRWGVTGRVAQGAGCTMTRPRHTCTPMQAWRGHECRRCAWLGAPCIQCAWAVAVWTPPPNKHPALWAQLAVCRRLTNRGVPPPGPPS